MADIRTLRRRSPAARARRAAALATLAVLLGPAAARAAEPPPRGHAEVRVGVLRLDYEERDAGGRFLDGEEGLLPAVAAEAELRGERAFGGVAVRLARGTVDYDGHVQSRTDATLDGLPVRTRSDASFLQGELRLGAFADDARRLAVFAAVGGRRWTRDILGTTVISRTGTPAPIAGLSEVYTWYELQLGGRWTFLDRAGTRWDLEARVVRTAGAEISVDLAPFVGSPTTAQLALASRTGWRLASELRQDVAPRTYLALAAWAEGYAFGRSDVDPTYGIMEPDSSTVNIGLEVGLGARF